MASYRLEFSNQAERAIRRIAEREPALYQRVVHVLDDLGRDPFQGKPLKGELKGRYSYRVGSYRILYLVRRHQLLVLVIDIGHRRDIYR
ncbi:MAG: type II toxin-antitoxin system RelE/ParE family toxin [Elusimicrobia bacterium]|nr:type II toxin-antitoxin system RelE/ParE family toxin [Elusimicrobiota bacterium]